MTAVAHDSVTLSWDDPEDATITGWATTDPARPTRRPAPTALASGTDHSCAIATDDTITCWGRNDEGRADAPAGTYKAIWLQDSTWSHWVPKKARLMQVPQAGQGRTELPGCAWTRCIAREGDQRSRQNGVLADEVCRGRDRVRIAAHEPAAHRSASAFDSDVRDVAFMNPNDYR